MVSSPVQPDPWWLIGASTAACVCGSMVIYADVFLNAITRSKRFIFQDNNQVLVVSLCISSGVLLFTSMFSLLPEALEYFKESPQLKDSPRMASLVLFATFLAGVAICAAFNMVIHVLTSQSVVHCAHDGASTTSYGDIESSAGTQQEGHGDIAEDEFRSSTPTETTQLLSHHHKPPTPPPFNLLDLTWSRLRGKRSVGKCMGYSDASKCRCPRSSVSSASSDNLPSGFQIPPPECSLGEENNQDTASIHSIAAPEEANFHDHQVIENHAITHHHVHPRSPPRHYDDHHLHDQHDHVHSHDHHDHHHHHDLSAVDHHHHVISPYSRLFSIGLQTALAISLHKIPEGFITFATYRQNPRLGFSVFTALAVHNFSEGFSIAFPLYLSLRKRYIAFLVAAALGGLSQPLGALIAQVFFDKTYSDGIPALIFGILVSLTSGFMSIIGLQMYGTSVAFGGKQSVTLPCAFLGIAIVGLSNTLTAT